MRTLSQVLALISLVTIAACLSVRPWRVDQPPLVAADLEGAQAVRVLTRDGASLELEGVRWVDAADGGRLVGRRLDVEGAGEVELEVAQLQRVETRRREQDRIVLNVVIWTTIGLIAFVALFYLAASSITVIG